MKALDYTCSGMLILGGIAQTAAGFMLASDLAEPALRIWFTLGGVVPILTGLANLQRARAQCPDRLLLTSCVVGLLAFASACVSVAIGWERWASPQVLWFLFASAGALGFTLRDAVARQPS